MDVLNLAAPDFQVAYQGLLPQGRIWPREADAVQGQVLAVLMPTWERLIGRDNNLLVDAFPATAVELLPEWEATLGLPDPCAGPAPSIPQRQAQVVARLTGRGGQSVPYFVGYAAALGYAITVTEFVPSRFGRKFGMKFGGPAWAHAWLVDASTVGTAPWGPDVLICELNEIKPAHTVLNFLVPAAGWDQAPGFDQGGWAP